jgi:hypothetical protein
MPEIPFLLPEPDVMPTVQSSMNPTLREWSNDEAPKPVCFVLGVDLGQARDFSAIAINEVSLADRITYQQTDFQPQPAELKREVVVHHRIRHVERIALGTSYPDVIDLVANRLSRVPKMPRDPVLVADATGCGRPVMDLMRKQGLKPLAVSITGGSGETISGWQANVAKKILASGVAVALDTERLRVVATGPHVDVLKNELRAFRVKVSASQNESFESWRENDHDDLVLATALAIWAGERLKRRFKVNPAWQLLGTR